MTGEYFCTTKYKWAIIFNIIIIGLSSFSNHVVASTIVKSLPGLHGSLPFKLETGYITVDENEDVEYFYYFVESEGNPRDDPLMLWFTGGPGCSALCGLVFEIGPIKFNIVEYNRSLPTLTLNPFSWTKLSSKIFVDAPVNTEFSYLKSLEGSQSNELVFANQGFHFIKKWLFNHPEFKSNTLYLGGSSYSGMIVPIVAEELVKILEANNIPKLNFKGYVLGNPRTDSKFGENSKVPFAHRMALISDELFKSVKKNCNREFRKSHQKNLPCSKDLQAVSVCTENLNKAHILEPKCAAMLNSFHGAKKNKKSLLEMSHEIQEELPEFGCRDYQNFLIYLWANDKDVQIALGVRQGTLKTWIRCNSDINFTERIKSVVSYHKHLNSRRRYRALIYSGDHDITISYIGTQAWIKSMKIPIVSQWRPWLVDDQIAGYTTEYANEFTFSTILGGGHTATEYKDKECFAMFQRWISNVPL